MSQWFDPYAQWLGIPPEEQPPDHYRLLGLPRFEPSRQAIADAIQARVALLAEHRTGPLAEQAAKLAGQIAAAGACLLDPQRRAAYDRRLQKANVPAPPVQQKPHAATAQGEERSRASSARALESGNPFFALTTTSASWERVVESPAGKRRKRTSVAVELAKIIAGAVVGIVLGVVILWYGFGLDPLGVMSRGKGRQSPPQGTTGIATGDGIARTSQAGSGRDATAARPLLPAASDPSSGEEIGGRDGPSRALAVEAGPKAVSPSSSTADPPGKAPAENASSDPTSMAASTDAAPMVGVQAGTEASSTQTAATAQAVSPAAPGAAPQAANPPVAPPSAEVEKQITASLEKIFDLDKVGSQAEAQQKLQQLQATAGDSGTTSDQRYVLLQLAGRQAMLARRVDALWQSWTQLTTTYLCDGAALLKQMLAAQRGDVYWITRVTAESGQAISQACRQGRVEQATAAIDALTELARSARPERATVAVWCLGEARTPLNQAAEWHREYQLAQTRLAVEADDAEAHRVAGRWLCLGADDWAAGLPHLARCGESVLDEAAKAEQSMDPNSPASLVAVADRWWQYAENGDRSEQLDFRAHAVRLYERALLPSQSPLSALEKARVEKLLAEPGRQAAKPLAEQIAAALQGGPSLTGKWVDLGPLTRLGMTPQAGKVALGTGSLVMGEQSRIFLPICPEGDYDLKLVFTRLKGDDAFGVVAPVAKTGCLVYLSGYYGRHHAIQLIDGQDAQRNPSKTTPGKIPNGVPLTFEIAVRVRPPLCSIQATLNRLPVLAWQGKITSLSVQRDCNLAHQVGIASFGNETTVVHSVSVRPLDDQAVLLFGN